MRRRSSKPTILWPFLSGLLLTSCGDFQDPASGSQGRALAHSSVTQVSLQEMGGSDRHLTPEPSANAVETASLPAPSGEAPASTETTGAGPQRAALVSESAVGQFSSPPQSGASQLSTGGGDNMPPWLSRAGSQPEPVGLRTDLRQGRWPSRGALPHPAMRLDTESTPRRCPPRCNMHLMPVRRPGLQ